MDGSIAAAAAAPPDLRALRGSLDYAPEMVAAFDAALAALPEAVRGDVWADKYKYLTDTTLLHALAAAPDARILEVGGARSATALMLRALGHTRLSMLDRFDQPDAERAAGLPHPTRGFWEGAGIEATEADVLRPLPYPDASFDAICAVDIVEHLTASSRGFLAELHRILRPGGMLLTGCPNHANLQNRIRMLFGNSVHSRLGTWHEADRYIGHVREFTPAEIETMVRAAGFEVLMRRMGEEELDSVIRDRARLQRDRTAGSNRLDLRKPGDLAFYAVILAYYGVAKLLPGCRYFTRVVARKPVA